MSRKTSYHRMQSQLQNGARDCDSWSSSTNSMRDGIPRKSHSLYDLRTAACRRKMGEERGSQLCQDMGLGGSEVDHTPTTTVNGNLRFSNTKDVNDLVNWNKKVLLGSIPFDSNKYDKYHCHKSRSLPHGYKLKYEAFTKNAGKLPVPVSPTEFRRRLEIMKTWFREFDDEQKNIFINTILPECAGAQNHVLSIALQDRLHLHCPPNCQDIITWLPPGIAYMILSYLDPVSLAQCAMVCRYWHALIQADFLWRRLCLLSPWQLSPAGCLKQLSYCTGPDGSIDWKRLFLDRFRLRRNWLKGHCHVRTFEGHTQGVSCVQFDDSRIVSGSHDKTIKVWNIRTNSPWSVMTLVGHSGTVRCLHLLDNRVVSGSTDTTIKVWDLSIQEQWSSIACKVTMVGHTDTVRCLQMDRAKVISCSYDQTLKVWCLKTGQCKKTLHGHTGHVLCMQFESSRLVSGSADRTIKIWDLVDGKCTATLHGHNDAVTCLAFDSWRIISGSLDRTIKFWSLSTHTCLSTLDWMTSEGHTGVIRCLQTDSWRIVSAADDKMLKVWCLETGQRLVTLQNHTDGVTCLQFNDFVIVSGSYDKTVKLWDFSVC